MNRNRGYTIIDEPRPGSLARLAVDPLWPFLALMVGGPWVGLPWFVFNGVAIGSASLRKEITWALVALVTQVAIWSGVIVLVGALGLGKLELGYLRFVPIVSMMTWGYVLHFNQARSAQLFVHFGGRLHLGWPLAIGASVARPWVADALDRLPSIGIYLRLVLA